MSLETIFEKLIKNEDDFCNGLNMVPSENSMSVVSRLPLLFDVYNRYNFNQELSPNEWFFRGTENVASIEKEIIYPILMSRLNCRYVNVNFISGLNCMTVVIKALGGKPGSEILILSRESGGHYATKELVESFGFVPQFIELNEKFEINPLDIKQKISKKTSLVYIDQSYALFPLDIKNLVQNVKCCSDKVLVHVDISHWLGLILGKAMQNPLLYADSIGGSTHKTFPGPQKGFFASNERLLYDKVKNTQYYMLSSNHFAATVCLALSLLEFCETGGDNYAKQILTNSVAFAEELYNHGCDVKYSELGFTKCHQVWADTQTLGVNSYAASDLLKKSLIKSNVLIDLPKMNYPTFRFGINEATRFGFKEDEVRELARLILDCVTKKKTTSTTRQILIDLKKSVQIVYGYKMDDPRISRYLDAMLEVLRGK